MENRRCRAAIYDQPKWLEQWEIFLDSFLSLLFKFYLQSFYLVHTSRSLLKSSDFWNFSYAILSDIIVLDSLYQGNVGTDGSTVYGFAFVDCAALRFWVGSINDDASCASLGALLMQVWSSLFFLMLRAVWTNSDSMMFFLNFRYLPRKLFMKTKVKSFFQCLLHACMFVFLILLRVLVKIIPFIWTI